MFLIVEMFSMYCKEKWEIHSETPCKFCITPKHWSHMLSGAGGGNSQVARIFSFWTNQGKQLKWAYFVKSMGCQDAAYQATVCSHNLVRQMVPFWRKTESSSVTGGSTVETEINCKWVACLSVLNNYIAVLTLLKVKGADYFGPRVLNLQFFGITKQVWGKGNDISIFTCFWLTLNITFD